MSDENKFRALFEDFLLHQHEVNPPVRSIDAVLPAITFKTDGPTFAEGLKEMNGVLNQLLAEMDKTRCRNCNTMFQPGVGVFTEHAYFVPTSDICADCLDERNCLKGFKN